MWRRQSILYSPERVERLQAFTHLLIEAAVLRRQRLDLVERLRPVLLQPGLLRKINEVVDEAEASYPNHTVSVSLMDDLDNTKFAPGHDALKEITPWKDTFCQYVVASGKPFMVTDSQTDLVVCHSPNASRVRSYNGVPLTVRSWVVGVVCLYADTPRDAWATADQARLTQWADTIVDLMEIELSLQ